jgi:hypothetical protein
VSTAARRGSYPHPVLDASDDVAGAFEVFNVTVTPSVEDVELRFQVRMSDPDIQGLLDAGRARFSFRWTCSSTIAVGELDPTVASEHADSTGYVAWLDQQQVRRTVRVEFRVLAAELIESYTLKGQHPDYAGATFTVMAGDVLADGGYFEFEPDKLYDPLDPPVGSCFKFMSDSKQRRGLRVQFHDDEHVLVVFPEKLLPGFAALGNRPDLQVATVVLPALMQTIQFVKENLDPGAGGEDLTEKSWYEPIRGLVEGVGSFDDPAFDLAQKILGNCLDSSLSKALEMNDEEDR